MREDWTSKIFKSIRRHKFISTVVITLAMFSIINVIMIYNFMEILQKV